MYIVIELQTNADGTVGNIVLAYSTREEAFQKYHLILAAAAVSGLPVHAAVILNNAGITIAAQAFRREPEPAEQPEVGEQTDD